MASAAVVTPCTTSRCVPSVGISSVHVARQVYVSGTSLHGDSSSVISSAASRTRNAATGSGAAAAKAARASAPGPAGQRSPTTSKPTDARPEPSTSTSTEDTDPKAQPMLELLPPPTRSDPPSALIGGK